MLPLLSPKPTRLFDYLPENTRLILEDPQGIENHLEGLMDEIRSVYENSESVEKVTARWGF